MSAGGSKLRWCTCPPSLSRRALALTHSSRPGPHGCHHRAPFFLSFARGTVAERVCARQIAAGVILAWGRTIYKQFELLAGKSAPHDFLQLIIYKATTFSDEIEQIDTVRAYHVRRPRPPYVSSRVLTDGKLL